MRRGLLLLVSIVLVVFGAPAYAFAADSPVTCPPGQSPDPASGQCIIAVETPGGGGGDTTPVNNPEPGSGGTQKCTFQGNEVPCVTEDGSWDGSGWCKAADPQPPKDDDVWQGNTDGVIVVCTGVTVDDATGIAEPSTLVTTYWAPSVPGAGPTARELADRAVSTMNLHAIAIGIVPESKPGSIGLVGMPTWMWAADPSESTTGPITRTASAGGNTVTATAHLTSIVWTMGDGDTVTCEGAGTPYADQYGKASSPDCGHTYTTQGRYTVSATSHWTVIWEGMGENGTIPLNFTDSAPITVGEAQVIVTN